MTKKINYNAKTFENYSEELKSFTKRYYPSIVNDFNDASIGQWFIDLNSAVADDLGYYIDKSFQETQLDQAKEKRSLLNIARNNGLRVGGKKPSIVEARWTCNLPVSDNGGPDYDYAPIILKGTQSSGGGQKFEVLEDINFSYQFNSDGISDRSFIPLRNSTGEVSGYRVSKTCVMASVESKIYRQVVSSSDVKPFMEIILPDNNVVSINSIVIKENIDSTSPSISYFMSEQDDRWYEVSNLTEDKMFKENTSKTNTWKNDVASINSNFIVSGNTYTYTTDDNNFVFGFIPSIGEWKSINKKFITEYTDNGYCKIIFGGGSSYNGTLNGSLSTASEFGRYQISRIVNNSFLGELPSSDSVIYVYYTVGGGNSSNIAVNSMVNIDYLDTIINGTSAEIRNAVKQSISVTNTIPSVSGRDELSVDEIRYLVKYNNAAQDRCVTIKDYHNRILTMPSKFGSPYKVGVYERNNKVNISILGLSHDGSLSQTLSKVMIDNMIEYLSEYRMINDYIEIKPGKIVNLKIECQFVVDSGYGANNISALIKTQIADFMNINKHNLGEEIYINKLKSAIGSLNGVKNVSTLKVHNLFGGEYSNNRINQPVINTTATANSVEVNLDITDGVLFSDEDTMFEIKKSNDIVIRYNK